MNPLNHSILVPLHLGAHIQALKSIRNETPQLLQALCSSRPKGIRQNGLWVFQLTHPFSSPVQHRKSCPWGAGLSRTSPINSPDRPPQRKAPRSHEYNVQCCSTTLETASLTSASREETQQHGSKFHS